MTGELTGFSGERQRQFIALTADIEGQIDKVLSETYQLLALFAEIGVRATLFFLGEIVERFPALVSEAAAAGHEIAFHGYRHIFMDRLSPMEFRRQLQEWLPRLEDLAQQRICGFRAPYFSIGKKEQWALQELIRAQVEYDASIYPGFNDRYGWPAGPRRPVRLKHSHFVLFPVPLLRNPFPIAFSGGAYLRIFPRAVVRWGLRQERRAAFPHMIYLHPWELSAANELPAMRKISDLRQWLTSQPGRNGFSGKVRWLLSKERSRIRSMKQVIQNLEEVPEWYCRS